MAGTDHLDFPRFANRGDLDSTFAMFSGSRALAENLALDREMILGIEGDENPGIPIADIRGITVRAIDWTARLKDGGEIAVDPLSHAIPADQHALFAPSIDALLELASQIEREGVPFLRSFAVDNPSENLIPRYRRQLGLDLPDMLARQMKVNGVAVTGGDSYFPSGTDVAVVFDPEDPKDFETWLLAAIRIKALSQGAKMEKLEIGETRVTAFRNADRSLSSYIAMLGRFVVVSNSPTQIDRLAAVASNEKESLGSIDEFRFFRHRYPLDEKESAFVFISDDTIRRWCGPELRIGASRRTRATAALIDLKVRDLNGEEPAESYAALLGNHAGSGGGIQSEIFGSLAFMTPISELGIQSASVAEKTAYENWRRSYETGWPLVFDPIAMRLMLSEDQSSMDMTILPLTTGSDYESWIEIAGNSRLSPRARAVPDGAPLFLSMAIDREAEMFRMFDKQLVDFLPGLKVEPLAWMGESFSIWIDGDPLVEHSPHAFMSMNGIGMLPLVARIESRSAVRLSLFLTSLRASIEKSSPGMLKWDNRTHGEAGYVAVGGDDELGSDLMIYYAPRPGALLFSLDEFALIRAIERENAPLPRDLPETRHAFGEITTPMLQSLMALDSGRTPQRHLQQASWSALPILNEWKARQPDADPADFHRRHFAVAIECPGGAGYRWNAEAMTMESATFGHPSAPRDAGEPEPPFARHAAMRAGLDFEDGGLRVRAAMGGLQERIGSELVNDGELLGMAADFFLNDPDVRLVFEFDDFDIDAHGEVKSRRITSTDRLLPRDGDEAVLTLQSDEGGKSGFQDSRSTMDYGG